MKALTLCLQGTHVLLSCISQEHTQHQVLCFWGRLGPEDKRPGKGWASHKHTGVLFSFKIQDWLLPRQVLAHPTVKGGRSARAWGSRVERETKRDNWLSFFLPCWSCETGEIYNARTYSRFFKGCLQLYIIFPGVKCLYILSTRAKMCIFIGEWMITGVSQSATR